MAKQVFSSAKTELTASITWVIIETGKKGPYS
jgi:hypothetical protein